MPVYLVRGWTVTCAYDGPDHQYPPDWIFGGADGCDPRTDPRWMPNTYTYYSEKLDVLHTTQVPLCDDQAIDEFTLVRDMGPGYDPKFLAVQRPGESKPTLLRVEYDHRTDIVKDT